MPRKQLPVNNYRLTVLKSKKLLIDNCSLITVNSQKGIVHIFLVLFLLGAIGGTTYLVQQRTHFLPFADNDNSSGNNNDQAEGNDNSGGTGGFSVESHTTDNEAGGKGDGPEGPADGGGGGGAPGGMGDGNTTQGGVDHGGYETATDAQTAMQGSWEAYQDDIANGATQEQIDASRGAYEAAAGAYESFGFEASDKAGAVAEAGHGVQDGLSVEEAIGGHESTLGPDGIAAVMGSVPDIDPEQAGRNAVEYAVAHNYTADMAAGMGAIATQTAGGTAQQAMEAAALGEQAITGEFSVAGSFATGSYMGLDQQTIAEISAGIAISHGLTAEQFAEQAVGSQLGRDQLTNVFEGVATGNAQALAAEREAAREAIGANLANQNQAQPVGTTPAVVPETPVVAAPPAAPVAPAPVTNSGNFTTSTQPSVTVNANTQYEAVSQTTNINNGTYTVATVSVTTGIGSGNRGEGQTEVSIPGQTPAGEPINVGSPMSSVTVESVTQALGEYNQQHGTNYSIPSTPGR